jgi:glutaconate CoA-transferase subunit A
MSSKIKEINKAVEAIQDGMLLALGGNTLNRAPMAAVYELARQGKQKLKLVKTAGAMDVDLLCFAGCVESVDAGFISYESQFSLCQHYRKGVEQGFVKANEHACYTVISALRAAAFGIPFLPVKGLIESDLIASNPYFARVKDPFTGEELTVVKVIRPDWAILHVQCADELGNARIDGPVYDDLLMSRAAKRVMITVEEIVPTSFFERSDRKADIPHFLVESVSIAPRGAAPCSCYGCYPVDEREVTSFLELSDKQMLLAWLDGRRGMKP